MKLTPAKVTAAYRAVLELSNIVFPYKPARSVATLAKRLAEENDIVADMEKKLAAEYGGEMQPSGVCDFPDPDTAKHFRDALEEIREQEAEIKLPTVDLSRFTSSIRISAASIEALEGIVIFERTPRPEEENTDG